MGRATITFCLDGDCEMLHCVRRWVGKWGRAMACALACLPAALLAAPVKTPHVTAELVAERSAVQPGQPLRIGLSLQHIPHWHTYWRNPGDSGQPTSVTWTLPDGAQVGEIEWPMPKRLPIGPLVNYGYEDDLLLPLSFLPPADARPGDTLTLRADAQWLVCKDVCIPEQASLVLEVPVVSTTTTPGSTAHGARFAQHEAARPAPLAGWTAQAQQQAGAKEVLLSFTRTAAAPALPPGGTLPVIHVFPYAEQVLEPARHEVYVTPQGYAVKLARIEGSRMPAVLSGIAVAQGQRDKTPPPWGDGPPAAEFSAPVTTVAQLSLPEGARLLVDTTQNLRSAGAAATLQGGTAALGLLAALGLAFLGGMVLNLMPCVFPVLSIKLLGLARHTPHEGGLRLHAVAYAAGVVLSFLALAGLLLALRATGSALGWGFQLQEPGVVFALALLFFVLGLNLMGGFEFGTFVPGWLSGWRARHPAADAFASGVLAVLAASPCTAPFMGAALGFALTQSAATSLAVFAALGLGMALPYMVLVLAPGWRDRLPRPGPWMLRLKQGLAFPMFATVVWLVWVLGQQTGVDGAGKALLALVGLAFVVWLAGLSRLRGTAGRIALLAVLAAGLAWSWPQGLSPADHRPGAATASQWQPYDEAVLAQAVGRGQPVFVDFTAAWCVSCQVNKRLVLDTDATQQAFADAKVLLMRADWTHRDETITQALARLGRNGVPVYVLIRPGREPVLLPEILTGPVVRNALATL
jgi:thiol:disulfide interchange protein/DsbC/DsbD-like thiol-disulfide interchange protein